MTSPNSVKAASIEGCGNLGTARGLDGGILLQFLKRHPFASQQVIERLFGERGLAILLMAAAEQVRTVEIPAVGSCFAERDEPDATLIGAHRREIARRVILQIMGPGALASGISPGFEAALEYPWPSGQPRRWYRIWVDMGGCAPETLCFVGEPPAHFGGAVRDLIITINPERLELLANQIEERWCGAGEVHFITEDLSHQRSLAPGKPRRGDRWKPPKEARIAEYIQCRRQGSHHLSGLGKSVPRLTLTDWDLLAQIGDHPVLSPMEHGYLKSRTAHGIGEIMARITELEELRLIETEMAAGPRCLLEERKILAWRGLELLAGHWGSSLELVRRFQPWPLKPRRGHLIYSTRWLRTQKRHQDLVRQFALALVDGARRMSNSHGGVSVEIETTIAARIVYRRHRSDGVSETCWVAPDARAVVEFWGTDIGYGCPSRSRLIQRNELWIEVDRGTITVDRLRNRVDRYGIAQKAMAARNPVLLWMIDGSPYRESQILGLMRSRGMEGWTVMKERLTLPAEDAWWLVHPHISLSREPSVGLSHEAIGGMAPWRRVWRDTHQPHTLPLLYLEPWKDVVII